ncbi:MAG: MFS transporter [Alphaproteobacteria bacterium]|nr:MFS transporter [Alphaproteobacteria bacterium]
MDETASRTNTRAAAATRRHRLVIAAIAFLTLVDLFATQAILPSLAVHYAVSPAAMGTAVNASTVGMAIAGLAVGLLGGRIDRRRGVVASLALLALPTALLAVAPDLVAFTALRVLQGLCMAAAFTLTLAHLAENATGGVAASAAAAYITGNVASNLLGRMMAAASAEWLGLADTFLLFAILNLAGAVLAFAALRTTVPLGRPMRSGAAPWLALLGHLATPALRRAFAIGFCILFAFIGTFTYVNFVLVAPPLGLPAMALGLIYLVFLPSIVTTPFAGRLAERFGARRAFWGSMAVALAGLPLLLLPTVAGVLAGLVLVGAGTFLGQAIATGFVGRAAAGDRASASGLYLASYFLGGLAGSAVLGHLFVAAGWPACVLGVALALSAACVLATGLRKHAPGVSPAAFRRA